MRKFVTAQNLHSAIVELEKAIDLIKKDPPSDHKKTLLDYLKDSVKTKRKQFSDL